MRIVYQYNDQGDLFAQRNLSLGESARYGYTSGNDHLLSTIVTQPADSSVAIDYTPAPVTSSIVADLGSPGQFIGESLSNSLATSPHEIAVPP